MYWCLSHLWFNKNRTIRCASGARICTECAAEVDGDDDDDDRMSTTKRSNKRRRDENSEEAHAAASEPKLHYMYGACPSCGSRHIEQYDASGEGICTECAVVVEENKIASEPKLQCPNCGSTSIEQCDVSGASICTECAVVVVADY